MQPALQLTCCSPVLVWGAQPRWGSSGARPCGHDSPKMYTDSLGCLEHSPAPPACSLCPSLLAELMTMTTITPAALMILPTGCVSQPGRNTPPWGSMQEPHNPANPTPPCPDPGPQQEQPLQPLLHEQPRAAPARSQVMFTVSQRCWWGLSAETPRPGGSRGGSPGAGPCRSR